MISITEIYLMRKFCSQK